MHELSCRPAKDKKLRNGREIMEEKINILVVDDDAEIADLVEIYLCSAGYTVFKAFNAKDGLSILAQWYKAGHHWYYDASDWRDRDV